MSSTQPLPSLLIFGPQTQFPSAGVLAGLREELINNPSLSGLVEAIESLPQFWKALTEHDQTLDEPQGAKHVSDLRHWALYGGTLPHQDSGLINVFAVPVTVILQLTQYIRYITGLRITQPHLGILAGLRQAGVQGFCIGFLGALVVASARSEADIGNVAGTILRLAVCIGAYVDNDGVNDTTTSSSACVAVRWKEGMANGKGEVSALIHSFDGVSSVRSMTNSKTYPCL